MKFGFLLFVTILAMTNSDAQISNSDSLSEKIIAAFRKQKFEDYKMLLLNSADYQEMLKDYFENNNYPITEQKEAINKAKHFDDTADVHYAREFKRLLEKGINIGIDWTQIKKVKFVFNEQKPSNSGNTVLSGHLNFSYKDSSYTFFGIEVYKLSSGYKISEIRTVLKGEIGQYVDPDLLDDDDN